MNINRDFVATLTTPPPAGFDKLGISSKDFEVKDTINFEIDHNRKKQGQSEIIETPLFMCQGKQVNGTKAWHNAGEEMGNLRVNINYTGLGISWNPSKLLGKYTGEIASPNDVQEGIKIVQNYLDEIGISTNLQNHKLTRLDFAKDRQMSDKVSSYLPALRLLNGKRMNDQKLYPSGLLFGNRQKEYCSYDKGEEINPDNGSTNNCRGEVRFLKDESVQRYLKFSHLHQLKDFAQGDLTKVYSDFFLDQVFRMEKVGEQLSFNFLADINFLSEAREKKKQNAFKEWIMLFGVEHMLEVYGMDNIEKILKEAGYHRVTIINYMNYFRTLISKSKMYHSGRPSIGQKLNEYREKFAS